MKFYASIFVMALILSINICAAEEFKTNTKGQFGNPKGAVRRGTTWHGRDVAAGALGFEIAEGKNLRLLQRGVLDMINRSDGTRETWEAICWLDFGAIRGSSKPKLSGGNWCTRVYDAGNIKVTAGRLSPAVMIEVNAPKLDIFAGKIVVGKRNPSKKKGPLSLVPKYVAYKSGGKIKVAKTDSIGSIKMDESWLLFWYGNDSLYYRTAIPNILWRTRPLDTFLKKGGYFIKADVPMLVVLQKKPKGVNKIADAIQLSFGVNGGTVMIAPLLGLNHPPVAETEKWALGLPKDIASACSTWAKRLKFYPTGCAQSYSVKGGGISVSITDKFTLKEIKDEWGTKGEKMAPLPPVVALDKQYGYSVDISGKIGGQPITTHSGPYTGVLGTDISSYTVKGLDKYVNQTISNATASDADSKILVSELRKEIDKMCAAGQLASKIHVTNSIKMAYNFDSPRQTLWALAEALPYLDDAGKGKLKKYIANELKNNGPFGRKRVDRWKGARREYWPVHPLETYTDKDKAGIQKGMSLGPGQSNHGLGGTQVGKPAEDQANAAYGFWAYGHGTGDWTLPKRNWQELKKQAFAGKNFMDWATCAYIKGRNAGNIDYTNGRFARYIAMVRMAKRFNDQATLDRSLYLLARTSLHLFAHEKLTQYLYDSKIITITEPSDWMFKYSTNHIEAGAGLIWSDKWKTGKDDFRTATHWDEFGPYLDHSYRNQWDPRVVRYQQMTPECGHFLQDNSKEENASYLALVEKNCPAWFIVNRPSNIGKETWIDNPANAYQYFLGMAYALGKDGKSLMKYQDIPCTKVGDIYQIRKIVANLRALNGSKWEAIK